jgi:uncharacterized membrane protein
LDRYELLKFVHIVAAMVWVGGVVILQFVALRTIWSGEPLRLVAFMRDAEWIGNRVILPSALVVILLGFLLVWDGPWELTTTWVWLALALYAVSFVLGLFVLTPQAKRIGNRVEAEGAESPGVQAQIKRVLNLGRIDIVLLVAIVYLMVVKPGV